MLDTKMLRDEHAKDIAEAEDLCKQLNAIGKRLEKSNINLSFFKSTHYSYNRVSVSEAEISFSC